MQAKGFSEDTLKIVRTEIETSYASVPTDPLSLGIILAQSAQDGDARAWKREIRTAKTVTAEDVSKAFRDFKFETALVSVINPGPRNTDYPPVIAGSTGVSNTQVVAARAEIVIPEIAMEKAADVVLPASETRKLASGATLVSYKIEDPAKVGFFMVVKGGDNDAPISLSNLAMAVTQRGAGDCLWQKWTPDIVKRAFRSMAAPTGTIQASALRHPLRNWMRSAPNWRILSCARVLTPRNGRHCRPEHRQTGILPEAP